MTRLVALIITLVMIGGPAVAGTKYTVDQRVRRNIRMQWVAEWREAQALIVFTCESGLNPWAVNPAGYWGVAQMGEHERKTTNWGWRIKDQLRAAKQWFNLTGRTWGPWPWCRLLL